ncbi:LacI family DNA-binding transcriptional regulator [Actinocatenispora rupis]|uniref:LacI family transcriptional regulator n=1 Tax=Actinocatenispora rupis TaxID=519421 RepID=A0A8J3J644_9ACTN|nr:LacI family DNA-binding transcriptional regulator [Actinocatenispora rupis]GID10887.1 LacI family transcriptional regulator [Actinocatenispora rupis]
MSTSSTGAPRRPTMADVARAAGVSLKTVSRVVNNVPTVDAALAERVLAAVTELGFRRNDMARNLRSRTTSATVGLLIEDLANPFYSAIAAAAAECALAHDTMLITASSEEDGDRERRLLLEMCERRVDGLLVVPAAADQVYLRAEIDLGTPVVFLDRPPTNLRTDTVLIDNARGARSAIEYLVAKGHRRIGVLSDWLSIYTMRERMSAAEAALERARVPYRPDLIRYGLHTLADTETAVEAMLDSDEPPTALFALNNRLTLGALSVLNRRGSDAVIVGFDDFETARLMPHPLTIISYDAREMGRVGAELLFRRIAGDASRPQTVVIPTTLIERSTG